MRLNGSRGWTGTAFPPSARGALGRHVGRPHEHAAAAVADDHALALARLLQRLRRLLAEAPAAGVLGDRDDRAALPRGVDALVAHAGVLRQAAHLLGAR